MCPADVFVFDRVRSDPDLDAVAELEARCFTNPWTREMLGREVATGTAHVFVLRQAGGGVVAFCSCWVIVDELHINTVAVDVLYRRSGLGARLMRGVMREAAALGATRATLEVRASNTAARRLYETLGFSVAAIRPVYYTQPEEDGLILWREGLAVGAGPPC